MLLNTLTPDIKCSVNDLKNAFATDLIKIKPAEKANILKDVWDVVGEVERYREGLIGRLALYNCSCWSFLTTRRRRNQHLCAVSQGGSQNAARWRPNPQNFRRRAR